MRRLLIVCIVLFVAVAMPKWGTYRPGTLFTLLNSQTDESLQFGVAERQTPQQADFNEEDVHTLDTEVKSSRYLVHDGQSLFRKEVRLRNGDHVEIAGLSEGNSAELTFMVEHRSNNYYFLKTSAKEGTSSSRIKLLNEPSVECTTRKVHSNDLRVLIERVLYKEEVEEGSNTLISCSSSSPTFNISFTFDKQPVLAEQWPQRLAAFEAKLTAFMKSYKLELDSDVKGIVRHGLSTSLSSISVWDGFVDRLFGFRNEEGEFDIKYSMLLMEVLADFDSTLAHELFNHTVEYLEDKIIYGEEELDELPCPEHIEAFLRFPNNKALRVVNGLLFRTIFQRVNKVIGKEEDYSANKRIHPILLTMLQAKWHSKFEYLAAGSVYTESFLEDLFLNSGDQQQDISLSKLAWLLKTATVLKQLNAAAATSQSSLSAVEIDSLIDLLTRYLSDECTEKQNNLLRSITRVGRNRYYSKYPSIESVLPHVYGLIPKYEPTYVSGLQLLRNLTSEVGTRCQEAGAFNNFEEYRFRGNISPYFNYKIMRLLQREHPYDRNELLQRFSQNESVKDLEGLIATIRDTLQQVRSYELRLEEVVRTAVREKVVADWRSKHRLFGWWAPTGKSYQPDSHLVLLNVLFLRA